MRGVRRGGRGHPVRTLPSGGAGDALYRLLIVLLPLGLGGLGLAMLGGRFMAGRAIRPVDDSFERQRAFVADASHELKTPLTLIRADAEVVLFRGRLHEDDRKLVEHALAETDRMGAVLSDLLLVARLDAGKVDVSEKPFDLVGVLSEEAERFGARAAGKDVLLEVEVPGELPALGDAKRTEQILGVLLDNAVKFTSAGGRIAVRAGCGTTGRRRAWRTPGLVSCRSTSLASSIASTGPKPRESWRGRRWDGPRAGYRPGPRPCAGRRTHRRERGGRGSNVPPSPAPGVSEPLTRATEP